MFDIIMVDCTFYESTEVNLHKNVAVQTQTSSFCYVAVLL